MQTVGGSEFTYYCICGIQIRIRKQTRTQTLKICMSLLLS